MQCMTLTIILVARDPIWVDGFGEWVLDRSLHTTEVVRAHWRNGTESRTAGIDAQAFAVDMPLVDGHPPVKSEENSKVRPRGHVLPIVVATLGRRRVRVV